METSEKFTYYNWDESYNLSWRSLGGWGYGSRRTYCDELNQKKIEEIAATETPSEERVIASMVTSNLDDLNACKVTFTFSKQ